MALTVVLNMIVMGSAYSLANNVLCDKYMLAEDTIAESEQLVKDIADEGIVLLRQYRTEKAIANHLIM